MIQAYKSFWSQAFNFKGRTSRADSSNEGILISLVDVIEESGFIPALEKDDFNNVA